MSVIPTTSTLVKERSAVKLPRYANKIEYHECAIFGVRKEGVDKRACREIWVKNQRDTLTFYLCEAQEELENQLGYLLEPTWIVGLLSEQPDGLERLVDAQDLGWRMLTRWARLLVAGKRATSDISLGRTVDHTTDPAVVGPLSTTVTNPDEIKVYFPGTTVEIHPSSLTLSCGLLTLQIPRCRLVKQTLADNPSEGLAYETLTNFEATVDIKRVYNDSSTNAVLVTPHTCAASCSTNGCAEYTQTACLYLDDPEIGEISLRPATYSTSTAMWTPSGTLCCSPSIVRLYYQAGEKALTYQAEDAITRLAHSKMPNPPCGCDWAKSLWLRDRNIPEVLTRERLNNPFGLSDGAWVAWQFMLSLKEYRLSGW